MRLPYWLSRKSKASQREREPEVASGASNVPTDTAAQPGPPAPFKVLVYGYDDLKPIGREQLSDGIVMHYDPRDSRFDEFDCVVVPYRAFLVKAELTGDDLHAPIQYRVLVWEPERDRRDKEIEALLRKGGVVCWLLDKVPQAALHNRHQALGAWVKSNALANLRAYPGFFHLYYWAGYALSDPWSSVFPTLHCHRSEFAQWVASHASTRHSLELIVPDNARNAQVICTLPNGDPAGLAIPVGAGLVVVLPYLPANRPRTEVASAMHGLARALRAYRDAVTAAPPPWLDEFCFTHERTVRDELTRLDQLKAESAAKLAPYEQQKRLLYLGDHQLTEDLVACLEARGLNTQRKEQFVEDFFLLDSAGALVAICEVKGLDANLRGNAVNQLSLCRSQRALDHNFPGVLFANTFRKAETLAEKDHRVEPKTCQEATHLHIAVVRTLDLLRLFDQMDTGQLNATALLTRLTEKPGWLRVEPDGTCQVLQE